MNKSLNNFKSQIIGIFSLCKNNFQSKILRKKIIELKAIKLIFISVYPLICKKNVKEIHHENILKKIINLLPYSYKNK